jgi:hypothetical protein
VKTASANAMIAETTQALGGKMRRKKKVSNKKK